MGMIGTFETFTTARLGIYAAQKGLSVVGNNISNLNTVGYTRQVIDQVSFKAGANDMYRSMMDNHVGSGALVTGISQIRDPYLDIRYRNTNSEVGYKTALLEGLQQLKSILDEVGLGEDTNNNEIGDGLLFAQLRDLHKSLEQLSLSPTKENDGLVRESAKALVALFNTYATKLENLHQETEQHFYENVDEVNDILTNIRNLNKSIRDAEISGDKALEMRDERNRQIDALSEYMHIKVEYSMEDVGSGIEVEKLTISLGNSNPDSKVHTDEAVLVDGVFAAQLSVPETMPRINPDFGSTDPDKADLKDFLYLKEDPANPGTLIGTNKAEDAQQVDNNIYNIQIGKLLDSKGKEWKDSTVTWEDNVGGTVATKTVYNYILTSSANTADTTFWSDGDTIEIGGETFTVGQGGLTLAIVQDSGKLASFIAGELNKKNTDYTVTANGSNIVFTAKKAGAPGSQGPAAPTLNLTNGGTKLALADGPQTDGVDSVKPGNGDADEVTTIDPDTGTETKVEYRLLNNQWYKVTTVTEHTQEVTLDDNDLQGALQAMRELLTEKGEFATTSDGDLVGDPPVNPDMVLDEGAAKKRGIPYYQMSFDLLARKLAEQFNSLNQGYMVNQNGNYIDENGKELTLPDGSTISKTDGLTSDQKELLINMGHFTTDADGNWVADLDDWLENNGGFKPEGAGNLFSNSNDGDDPTNITAKNLSVSHSWYIGDVKIVPSHVQLFGEDGNPITNSTQNDNIDHMISLDDQSLLYDPRELDPNAVSSKLFVGCFNDMFSNMNTILGADQRTTTIKLNTDYTSLIDIDTSRDNVSGVDLNDETMNMMMYQKAYTAACRVMTVIDEVLDRLINNTAI